MSFLSGINSRENDRIHQYKEAIYINQELGNIL